MHSLDVQPEDPRQKDTRERCIALYGTLVHFKNKWFRGTFHSLWAALRYPGAVGQESACSVAARPGVGKAGRFAHGGSWESRSALPGGSAAWRAEVSPQPHSPAIPESRKRAEQGRGAGSRGALLWLVLWACSEGLGAGEPRLRGQRVGVPDAGAGDGGQRAGCLAANVACAVSELRLGTWFLHLRLSVLGASLPTDSTWASYSPLAGLFLACPVAALPAPRSGGRGNACPRVGHSSAWWRCSSSVLLPAQHPPGPFRPRLLPTCKTSLCFIKTNFLEHF